MALKIGTDLTGDLSLEEAIEIVGSNLGTPSKMPGYSWGISAHSCQRGGELAAQPDTVCSRCYARTGRYLFPSVRAAHQRREEAIESPHWTDAMVFLIRVMVGRGYFRWFDSGDLQSVGHLCKIAEVCERTQRVSHWLPTHERGIVEAFLGAGGRLPSNLVVRISADYIEDQADAGELHGSTVHRWPGEPVPGAVECRSWTRENHCGPCRACWDPRVRTVSYLYHYPGHNPHRRSR